MRHAVGDLPTTIASPENYAGLRHSSTFGVPCPTTVFTFGMLLWCVGPVPWRLLAIPTLWALVGTSEALSLGMIEDFALPLAALIAASVAAAERHRIGWHAAPARPLPR